MSENHSLSEIPKIVLTNTALIEKKLPLPQVFGKGRKLEIIIMKFESTILCRTKLK